MELESAYIYGSSPPIGVSSHTNCVHTLTQYSSGTRIIVTLNSASSSSKWSLLYVGRAKILYALPTSSCVLHAHPVSPSIWDQVKSTNRSALYWNFSSLSLLPARKYVSVFFLIDVSLYTFRCLRSFCRMSKSDARCNISHLFFRCVFSPSLKCRTRRPPLVVCLWRFTQCIAYLKSMYRYASLNDGDTFWEVRR